MTRSLVSLFGWTAHGVRSKTPSFLVLGDSQAAFEAIAPLLDCLARSEQRVGCFLSAAEPSLRRWLEERFPSFAAVPPALGFGFLGGLFLRRLKVRTVILLEREAVLSPAQAANLKKRAIPLVLLSGRGALHARRGMCLLKMKEHGLGRIPIDDESGLERRVIFRHNRHQIRPERRRDGFRAPGEGNHRERRRLSDLGE